MAEALGPPVPGGGGRLALIGPSLHDVREVMIEGVSGIVGLARWAHPKWGGRRPVFEPSRRRLTFPNGAMAYAFSAEDPDSLRGPQFAAAWADEFCAWPRTRGGPGETLALLRMGLRLPGPVRASEAQAGSDRVATGSPPRLLVTTTPKPIAALRALRAEAGCVQTHAATRDNAAHLSAGFVEGLERLYGGTRKAEQELEGRVVEADGALFTSEMLARARGAAVPHPSASRPPSPEGEGEHQGLPIFDRVVVAIDPTTTAGGNACGIVVAGRYGERVHVLADRSVAGLGPDGWARRAVQAAEEFGAAALVAEVNQGGEMVQAVLKTAGCAVRVRPVRATKGKRVRAEPVAALYEQGRVTHAPGLGALEEELMAFGGEDEGQYDLDRADALVWAVTDLLIDRAGGGAGLSGRAW
ncbi:phage terminase large subunit family protein [Brevundimonas sp.]